MTELPPVKPNELHVWRSIETFRSVRGRWPRRTEIVEMTGWGDSKARWSLARLLEKGYVRYEGPRYSPATTVSIVSKPVSVEPGTRLAVTFVESDVFIAVEELRALHREWPMRKQIALHVSLPLAFVWQIIEKLIAKEYLQLEPGTRNRRVAIRNRPSMVANRPGLVIGAMTHLDEIHQGRMDRRYAGTRGY